MQTKRHLTTVLVGVLSFMPVVFSETCTAGQSCQGGVFWNSCTDCPAGEYQPPSAYSYEGYDHECSYPSTCQKCPSYQSSSPKSTYCYDTVNLPSSFRFPTGPVLDQGGCGSCYTFATNQVFADRTNKALGRTGNPIVFSPQAMVSCNENFDNDGQLNGCAGGKPLEMFEFIKQSGAKTCSSGYGETKEDQNGCSTGCAPYKSGFLQDGEYCQTPQGQDYCWGQDPSCGSMASCGATYPDTSDYGPACLNRNEEGYVPQELIKKHIKEEGPVAVTICANINFQQKWKYDKKAIYTASDWDPYRGSRGSQNDHAVVIVGWDTRDDISYWIVKNSWATSWGDEGFFYVESGKNVIGIEEDVCIIPPASQINGRRLTTSTQNATGQNFSHYDRSFAKISTSKTGHWFQHDVGAKDVIEVASHFATRHNSKLLRVTSAYKQIVNGNNHRITFDASAPDGTINTHTVSAYAKLDGTILKRKESVEAKSLSTLAIVGIAAASLLAFVGAAVFVHLKRRKPDKDPAQQAELPELRGENSWRSQL